MALTTAALRSEIPNGRADGPVERVPPDHESGPHDHSAITRPVGDRPVRHRPRLLHGAARHDRAVGGRAGPGGLPAHLRGRLQWATTAYSVVFGALRLSAGAVADRYGAHRVFRAAVAVFGIGSLLSAFAPALGALIALRVVLGAAGAACVPASMAMLARLHPAPAARARAGAVWAAGSGAAVAAGPHVGG